MIESAKLVLDNEEISLPVVTGSESEQALDTGKLRSETGVITLDPGYGNTGSCQSAITFIDGEKGILRYRGIPIEQFTEDPNFAEVAWLLIFGRLPNREDYDNWSDDLTRHSSLNESMKHHFEGFPASAPPMAILSAMINALSCFYPELHQLDDDAQFQSLAARLVSKIRTIAAYTYRSTHGLPYVYPDPKLPYAQNFLHMMFTQPYQQFICDDEAREALNLILILHADHEQNCSTSTVRMVGSGGANLFASVASGVSALWGHLHGGANVSVLNMLAEIHKGNLTPEEYVKLAKDKESGVRLMGFGHRVYKNFDPRAQILQRTAERVLTHLGISDPLLDIGRKLEEIALSDPYFVERNLYPNVDFYSGIILRAIGIPTDMFTVMFAMGRLPGWIAHWWEQHNEHARIQRPRQIYTGPTLTDYVKMEDRPAG
jgi:citrate synthase